MADVVKESFEVSAVHPDKVVVHGCDLVNRTSLSNSQNRELQRFIDKNAHKLGFYDRPHDEREDKAQPNYNYNSLSLNSSGRPYNYSGLDQGQTGDYGNRVGSPYSEYGTGGKRKGVKFADNDHQSHSGRGGGMDGGGRGNGDGGLGSGGAGLGAAGLGAAGLGAAGAGGRGAARGQSARPESDNHSRFRSQQPQRSRTQSPSSEPFRWRPYQSYEYDNRKRTVAPPVPEWLKDRGQTPAYSSLNKHPDNYNRYDTEKYRSRLASQSQERDEEIKFYGYGDRLGSGIELSRKRWTGGELVTDPAFITKSIKPRTMFYSPIGDGVVAADGIELKRVADTAPRRFVYYERVVEKGDPGHLGVKVTEKTWDDGMRSPLGNDDGGNGGRGNNNDFGNNGFGNNGFGNPDDDGGRRGPEEPIGDFAGDQDWPPRSGDFDNYPKSLSPLSIGTDGFPREGWTKTFITNPRELINQYGSETNTNIFDLEDHTPKTVTTVKETISPVP